MRKRPWLYVAGALVLGVGLGICVEIVRTRAAAGPLDGAETDLRAMPPAELGARLMARVGRGFVASTTEEDAVTFYDRPKPYGAWLCRANTYSFPRKVVTGRLQRPQERWEDDLAVERRYGIWRRPSAADGDRDRACAAFRDFGNMFVSEGVDGADPERAPYLLETVIAAARASGRLPFPLTCHRYGRHDAEGGACDGRAILRGLSLERLRRSKTLAFAHGENFGTSRDQLSLAAGPPHSGLVVTIVSEQHWGRHSIAEGEVRSVHVAVEGPH
ncbi:MAG TPA: hypothetical protein VFZ91_00140 [Allosphingosinicella sp.]